MERHGTLPLPRRQFVFFMSLFSALYLGGLVATLGTVLWHQPPWGVREGALTTLVALQAVLYVRTFHFNRRWPLPPAWLALYFGGSFLAWWAEWQLDHSFAWVPGALAGQAFGALPPWLSVPVVLVGTGAVLAVRLGWHGLLHLEWRDVAGPASTLGFLCLLGAYTYTLFEASRERARLIAELRQANAELEQSRLQAAELAALRERERLP